MWVVRVIELDTLNFQAPKHGVYFKTHTLKSQAEKNLPVLECIMLFCSPRIGGNACKSALPYFQPIKERRGQSDGEIIRKAVCVHVYQLIGFLEEAL
jgi:hypothetical protein